MEVKPIYLTMVTENNNNKYYNCFPNGDGTFTVKYGRVGGHETTTSYPMSKWNSQINSKLKKGYKDNSAFMTDFIEDSKVEEKDKDEQDEFSVIQNLSVRSIIKRLFDYANKVVQASYKVSASVVTQGMVDKAQEYIDYLAQNYEKMSLKEFNEYLIKIFTVIPRRMSKVNDYLADNNNDFIKLIDREQDTLDAMRGQVYKKVEKPVMEENNNKENVKVTSVLDKMGIIMEDATDEDVAKIKKAMGDASGKFYKAWRVTNKDTEEAYQKFVNENNIGNRKLCCHGSRNQNFFNILKTGLKIRPSCAIYTGSLLGDALYFSNPELWHGVAKSIGYTSLRGYWTGEHQNCGFIAFFECALGESHVINTHDGWHNTNLKKIRSLGKNVWSLHLKGAGHSSYNTVINDEITVYDERQVTIRYLVEIR